MRRLIRVACLMIVMFVAPAIAFAQAPGKKVPYIEINPPQPTEAQGKVEVIEFFWYGCPHCYALEPVLNPWIKKLPKEASFRRVPAIFNEQWGVAARVFYTLEAINEESRMHSPLFDAIHKENLRITDESAMAAWLAKKGVDVQKYKAAYRSFGVETKLKRALQMTQAYRIDGVPALAIQGRYVLSASMINDRQELLNATDQVIRSVIQQTGLGPAPSGATKSAPKSTSPAGK